MLHLLKLDEGNFALAAFRQSKSSGSTFFGGLHRTQINVVGAHCRLGEYRVTKGSRKKGQTLFYL
ncbi:MAG: hypothetical protein LBT53_05835 [Puniceicoccales bacterium]|nr:hypothetical protein [Puniceicoccales bacterium]